MFSGCKLINTDISEITTKLREKRDKMRSPAAGAEIAGNAANFCPRQPTGGVGNNQFATGAMSILKQELLCASSIRENS
jgi:hypothetical protein